MGVEIVIPLWILTDTVYPKKYAHGFCFAVLCCGYTLTDFPISIRLTSLALWQSNDCPSASKATLMNMDKYFMWIHYQWLHNHNKAKHNKTVCIFLGIDCTSATMLLRYLSNFRVTGQVITHILQLQDFTTFGDKNHINYPDMHKQVIQYRKLSRPFESCTVIITDKLPAFCSCARGSQGIFGNFRNSNWSLSNDDKPKIQSSLFIQEFKFKLANNTNSNTS